MAGHRFNPNKAAKLLDPKRKELINPEKVMKLLEIKEDDTIADLGAGNGYFTIPMAQKTTSTLYAVDVETKMLDLLKEQAEKAQLDNIHYIIGDLEDIPLRKDSVDKALIAFVTHEIPNLKQALFECKRIIKPGGQLLIVDWEEVEMDEGPPVEHRISSQKFSNILNKHNISNEIIHINHGVYATLSKINK